MPLPGSSITQFVTPLTTFTGQRVTSTSIQAEILEFQQHVLPDAVYSALPGPFSQGTYLWGYAVAAAGSSGSQPSYPGLTVEAQRGSATTITYVNNLPNAPVLRKYLTVDQTIHWADPLGQGPLFTPYTGPIPIVTHLHGGETPSTSDGVPDQWFTSNGLHRDAYYSVTPTSPNAATTPTPTPSRRRRCGSMTTRWG